MNLDLVNGAFELGGAIAISLSVRKLLQEKTVRGVHWAQTAFFTSWGLFNVFYYPSLGQRFSFYAGLLVAAVNVVYLTLLIKYIRAERQCDRRGRYYESGRCINYN